MLADEQKLIVPFAISSSPDLTFTIELLYISSSSVRYCAAVRADRITEYQHSSKPYRTMQAVTFTVRRHNTVFVFLANASKT
jgi:hypothetical protein